MKKWQALSLVMLIFLIGVASGAQGTRLVVRHQIKAALQKGPAGLHELLVAKLDRQLDLDKRQRAEVSTILADSQREFRLEITPRVNGIVGRAEQRIQRVLAADQQRVFENSVRERKQLWSGLDAKLALAANSGPAGQVAARLGAAAQAAAPTSERPVTATLDGQLKVAHAAQGLTASATLGTSAKAASAQAALTRTADAAHAEASLALPAGQAAEARVSVSRAGAEVAAQVADPVSGVKLAPSVKVEHDSISVEVPHSIDNRALAAPAVRPSVTTQRPSWNRPSSVPILNLPARR